MVYHISVYIPGFKQHRPLQWAGTRKYCIFQTEEAAETFLRSLKAIQPKLRASVVNAELPGPKLLVEDMTGKIVKQDRRTGSLIVVPDTEESDDAQ